MSVSATSTTSTTLNSNDSITPFRYVWFEMVSSPAGNFTCAEAQFFNTSITNMSAYCAAQSLPAVATTGQMLIEYALQISPAAYTPIGDLTSNGGLAAAFNNTTSESDAQSAQKSTVAATGYIGLNMSATPQVVANAIMYPSNVSGFSTGGAGLTFNLRGKQTAPSSSTDGTLLGSTIVSHDQLDSVNIVSNDIATAYAYVWVEMVSSSSVNFLCAELQLYTIATLNTDLKAYISATNTSNWTALTLAHVGFGQRGRLVAECVDTAISITGSTLITRFDTANNKNIVIHGVCAQVH